MNPAGTVNPAANLIEIILHRRRPAPREAARYASPAHAFSDLRRFSYLTRAQMAAKLGISEPMLQKIEGGMIGGNPQLDTVDRAMEIANDYFLTSVIQFFNIYRNHLRTKPKRGPRPMGKSDRWYMPEQEGVS